APGFRLPARERRSRPASFDLGAQSRRPEAAARRPPPPLFADEELASRLLYIEGCWTLLSIAPRPRNGKRPSAPEEWSGVALSGSIAYGPPPAERSCQLSRLKIPTIGHGAGWHQRGHVSPRTSRRPKRHGQRRCGVVPSSQPDRVGVPE